MQSESVHDETDFTPEQASSDTEALLKRVGEQHIEQRSAPTVLPQLWKKLRGWVVIALILACLETGGNLLYHHAYYASYRPAQCLIQSEQVRYVQPSGSNTSSPYYEPEVMYQITSPANASLDTYTGYAGPGAFQDQMPTSDGAQALLNQYQVGQSYPCWYSSFGIQPEAVLILQPFTWWEITLTVVASFMTGFLFFLSIFLLCILILRIRRLRKKGIVTMGTVVSEGQIVFLTSSDPSEKVHVPSTKPSHKPGSQVSVTYDPKDPHHNVRFGRPRRGEEIAVSCFVVLLWLPLMVFALYLFWSA